MGAKFGFNFDMMFLKKLIFTLVFDLKIFRTKSYEITSPLNKATIQKVQY